MVANDGVLLAQETKAPHREGEKCSRRETRVTGPVSVVEPGPDCGPSSSCKRCNPDSEPVLVQALHSEQNGTLNWNQHPPGPNCQKKKTNKQRKIDILFQILSLDLLLPTINILFISHSF